MASRTLKTALAVSAALNVFLLAGGAAIWVKTRTATEAEQTVRTSRSETVMELVDTRPQSVAVPLKEDLRALALTARPDFEAARGARREAITITASDDFDPAKVKALLEQSRAAELRGRARLETGAVDLLNGLEAEDRKALSRILSRHRASGAKSKTAETPASR